MQKTKSIDNAAEGVHNFLDLSVGHLPIEDRRLLYEHSTKRFFLEGPRVIAHGYGWFVHVPLDDAQEQYAGFTRCGFSNSFIIVLKFAASNNCWWVNFDQDAESIRALPYFNE